MKIFGIVLLVVALYVCVFASDNYIVNVPKNNRPPRCRQPIDRGNTSCHKYVEEFGFDVDEEQCVSFNYTGCGGNSNRFDTLRDCKRTCD